MIYNVVDNIVLDKWVKINLKKKADFYVIAIKNLKSKTGFDVKDIQSIRFEIGIDSGIKDSPITVGYFNLNFKDCTSSSNSINDRTAFFQCTSCNSSFYLKPISAGLYSDANGLSKGNLPIALNINTVE